MKWINALLDRLGSLLNAYRNQCVYLLYYLFLLRFLTLFTSVIVFFIALILKRRAVDSALFHIERLLNFFYIDVIISCTTLGVFGLCYYIAPPSEPGMWELVYILPVGLFLAWNVVLLVSLVNGICAFSARPSERPASMRTVRL
ncbi:hypothetical protein [Neokomagataea thailandica]|uniref:hypothetical protein n=1 Tax=Neokomagataea TaxID=1223423 RepID=UPI0012EEDA48|nr:MULTISPECIES: hypothetical protein [Neokomagataea]